MTQNETPQETVEAMLTAYGSQTENWPTEARDALASQIELEPKVAALFAREKRLDDWLDARLDTPSRELVGRVLASLPKQMPASELIALPRAARTGWRHSSLGASLTALAACFIAGFMVAPLIFETLTGAGDPLASLEIISTTFLPTEPL